ncbi:MAG: hypothetical protein GF311_00180 [Candidatus Lokiarchaeota archaeon]|nr:hypothetical protein [Candidatus Lokiarchaeota archaeon]
MQSQLSIELLEIKNSKWDLRFFVRGLWEPQLPLLTIKAKNLFENLINKNEILGAAIVKPLGLIIYSSLPEEILSNLLKELEIRARAYKSNYKKIIYLLDNNQKLISTQTESRFKFKRNHIIMVLFESSVSIGIAEVKFNKILKYIYLWKYRVSR